MKDQIEEALKYYSIKSDEIVDFVNNTKNLTTDQIIESGEELQIIEYKITALQVAKEN